MNMKKSLIAMVGALAITGIAATSHAETVTYSTTGVFGTTGTGVTSGGGTNSIDVGGGMTITFDDLTNNSVTVPPQSFASLGTFNVAGTGTSNTFSDSFVLTVTQSSPTTGSGTFTATVSGIVTGSASLGTANFAFSNTSITLGDIAYSLTNPDLALVPPTTNDGDTTVQASINVVPTPASVLAGSALLGLMGLAKMRSRRNAM